MGSDAVATAVRLRLSSRASAALWGGTLGLVGSAAAFALQPSLGSASYIWLVALPALLFGATALDLSVSLRNSLFRPPAGVDFVTRPRVTTMSDYVTPWRLLIAPLCVVVAAALCIGGVILGALHVIGRDSFIASGALWMFVFSAIVLVASLAVERRVLGQPQPATDTLELAWDDAFRADTLRMLRYSTTLVSWLAVAAAANGIFKGMDELAGTSFSSGIGSLLFTPGFLAVVLAFDAGRARSHFRHRLWPDLAEVSIGGGGDPARS